LALRARFDAKSEFTRRLGNARAAEPAALEEVGHITRLRLNEVMDGPGKPSN